MRKPEKQNTIDALMCTKGGGDGGCSGGSGGGCQVDSFASYKRAGVSYDLLGSCPDGAVLGMTEVVVVTGTAPRTLAGDTILAKTGLPLCCCVT